MVEALKGINSVDDEVRRSEPITWLYSLMLTSDGAVESPTAAAVGWYVVDGIRGGTARSWLDRRRRPL